MTDITSTLYGHHFGRRVSSSSRDRVKTYHYCTLDPVPLRTSRAVRPAELTIDCPTHLKVRAMPKGGSFSGFWAETLSKGPLLKRL